GGGRSRPDPPAGLIDPVVVCSVRGGGRQAEAGGLRLVDDDRVFRQGGADGGGQGVDVERPGRGGGRSQLRKLGGRAGRDAVGEGLERTGDVLGPVGQGVDGRAAGDQVGRPAGGGEERHRRAGPRQHDVPHAL